MSDKDTVQQARIDMAAAFRLAARYQLEEGIDNHFSYALPGPEERYLFNTYGKHWGKMKASDIIVVDGEGKTIEGNSEVERSAFCIHVPMHKANSDAKAVFHTHMPYATALSMVEDGRLEPAEQNALRFFDDVAYDEHYDGLAFDPAEGWRLAKVLGKKKVLFMANHGVTVVGDSVARAFNDLYFLERACRVQYLAQTWGKLRQVNPQVAHKTKRQFDAAQEYFPMFFDAMKRILDDEEPNYRH
jgi:ribulose-5-phosphate 4-epimerase/fuculose-1-phosphate aldolase